MATETLEARPDILVVDDEPEILRALKSILTDTYTVRLAASGEEAMQFAAEQEPDLVILDLALPGASGMTVCRSIREWSRVPIMILSVRSDEFDKITALDLGADDYLTKPFASGELLAHVRALLRRSGQSIVAPGTIVAGDLAIDLKGRTVTRNMRAIKLTPIEFKILAILASTPNRVVTSTMLLRSVWGEATTEDNRVLRVHVSNLRSKIEENSSLPRHLVTEPGVGYRFCTDAF